MSDRPSLFQRITRGMTVNDVTAGESEAYPELQPATFDRSPDEVLDAAEQVVESRPRWTTSTIDADARRLEFEATTRLMGFVDDVTVRIEPVDDSSSRVVVRSRSRVGRGDMGKNAERIEEFYDRLATKLRVRAA